MNRYPYSAFAGTVPPACLTDEAYQKAKKTALAKTVIGGGILGAVAGAVAAPSAAYWVKGAFIGAAVGATLLAAGALVTVRTLETQ